MEKRRFGVTLLSEGRCCKTAARFTAAGRPQAPFATGWRKRSLPAVAKRRRLTAARRNERFRPFPRFFRLPQVKFRGPLDRWGAGCSPFPAPDAFQARVVGGSLTG